MSIEREPQLRRKSYEEAEKKVSFSAPDMLPTNSVEEVLPPLATEAVQVPIAEINTASVTFEVLPQLVGKRVMFRDSEVTRALDDPLYKQGIIEKIGDEFVIKVDRGKYYPYYTGLNRRSSFTLYTQHDIDRLEVVLDQ
jgi:hypothetical protein